MGFEITYFVQQKMCFGFAMVDAEIPFSFSAEIVHPAYFRRASSQDNRINSLSVNSASKDTQGNNTRNK
jgi:hypothetical protein